MALVRLVQGVVDGAGGICGNGLALRLVEVAGLDRKDAARRIDHRRIAEMRGNPRGVERRRHDEDAEIVAQAALDVEREGEAEVTVERAFVEFVEDDEAHAGELRIGLQAAGEDAFGDHLDAGPGRDLAVEPHGVAHRAAHLLAQRLGHAPCRGARRKPARLEHDDLAAVEPGLVEEHQRHARCLAGARLGHEQGRAAAGQGRAELRDDGIDGKRHGAHLGGAASNVKQARWPRAGRNPAARR